MSDHAPDPVRKDDPADAWSHELHRGVVGRGFKVGRVLYSGQSPFQSIELLDNEWLGRVLLLYGSVMLTEREEFCYHEMIAHPALFAHPAPRRVMIVGGGDGCTLREVLRHPCVTEAVQVEIDRQVCDVSRRFLSDLNRGALDDPRATLVFQDAMAYVAEPGPAFDVILSDTSDPVGPAEVLFQKGFHQRVFDRLAPDGVFVCQTESPFFHEAEIRDVYRSLREVFPVVRMYLAHLPMYPSGCWSFAFCSKGLDPVAALDPARVAAADLPLRYYTADVHRGAFALPAFARDLAGPRGEGA